MGRDRSFFPTPHSPTALHRSGRQRPAERRQRRLWQAGTAAGDGGATATALGQGGRGRRGSAGRASFEPAGTGRVGTEGPWEGAGGWEEGGQVRPRVRAKIRRGRGGHGERGVPQAAYGGWKTGLRRLCGEFGPASALTLTPPGSEGSNCPRERRGDLGGLGVVERLTAGGD